MHERALERVLLFKRRILSVRETDEFCLSVKQRRGGQASEKNAVHGRALERVLLFKRHRVFLARSLPEPCTLHPAPCTLNPEPWSGERSSVFCFSNATGSSSPGPACERRGNVFKGFKGFYLKSEFFYLRCLQGFYLKGLKGFQSKFQARFESSIGCFMYDVIFTRLRKLNSGGASAREGSALQTPPRVPRQVPLLSQEGTSYTFLI